MKNLKKSIFKLNVLFIMFSLVLSVIPPVVWAQEIGSEPAWEQVSPPDISPLPSPEPEILPPSEVLSPEPDPVVEFPGGLQPPVELLEPEANIEPDINQAERGEDFITSTPPESTSPLFDPGKPAKFSVGSGQAEVIESTGALVYNYPLNIPTGRNGLQAQLNLGYHSQRGEQSSFYGYGWDINIPSVSRINKEGTIDLYNTFNFSLDLNGTGELVPLSIDANGYGTYGALVDNSFYKIESLAGNIWQVTDKLGTVYKFGQASSSRQDFATTTTQIYKWMLDEIRDTNNNFVRYEYYKDSGQIYPDKIYYTGYDTTDGIYRVEFNRVIRNDAIKSHNTAFPVTTNYKIDRINVYINSILKKFYTLNYNVGDNSDRSTLFSITEGGINGIGQEVTLPPVEFNYKSSDKTWDIHATYQMPLIFDSFDENFNADGAYTKMFQIADVNGDSLQDIIYSMYNAQSPDGLEARTYINNGLNGWATTTAYIMDYPFLVYPGAGDWVDKFKGLKLMDVNGDRLTDIVYSYSYAGGSVNKVEINNGAGDWVEDPSWSAPFFFVNYYSGDWTSTIATDYSPKFTVAEVNGDGLLDFIVSYEEIGGNIKEVYINNGVNGWDLDANWTVPILFSKYSGGSFMNSYHTFFRIFDVNGDGLDDIVKSVYFQEPDPDDDQRLVYINNGVNGWDLDTSWTIPFNFAYVAQFGTLNDFGPRFEIIDINADGLLDLVESYRDDTIPNPIKNIYINDGKDGWDLDNNYVIPFLFARWESNGTVHDYNPGFRITDGLGNGVVDYLNSYRLNSNPVQYINELYKVDNPHYTDKLDKIRVNNQDIITLSYDASGLGRDGANQLLHPDLPVNVSVVSEIIFNDGLGNTIDKDYKYSDGQYYVDSVDKNRNRFSGFARVEKVVADTKVLTYFHQGNSTNSSQGEYQDNYYKIGQPYRTEVYDNTTQTLLSQQINKWEDFDLGSNRKFVFSTQKSNTDFSGTDKSAASQFIYNTGNGNLMTEHNLGEVTINTGTGEITNQLTGDEKDTDYQYAVNETKHILSAPKIKQISDTTDNKIQNLYYDNSETLGYVDKANLTKEDYIDGTEVEVNRIFNSYGLVEKEISPEKATTTIAYDSYNLYPDTKTNPLNQVSSYDYSLLNGQPEVITAPNGAVTQNTYDAFGRLTKVEVSNPDSPSTLLTKQEITYQDTILPRHKETSDYFTATNYVTSREYYDGLDRIVQTKSQLANSNYATIDTSYDNQGRLNRQSLVYETNSLAYSAPDLNRPAKTYTYDALDRVLTETTPVGITTYQYDGLTTIITDPNGVRKDLTNDAYSNLVQVKEYNNGGANVYTTNYEYSLTNKLTKITDSASNIRNFTYDALDNLTNQDMVHKPATTPPAITYTHDKNGNVLTETSFKNDNISYIYDDINRVLFEKLAGLNKITYTYDDETKDIGQLTLADYGEANKKAYDYDVLGRLRHSTTTIDNINYVMHYDYNLGGSLTQVIYPNTYKVKYDYNTIGQVNTVSLDKGPGYQSLASNISYNPNGQLIHLERANGIITDYTYDPTQAYRLTDIDTIKNTTVLQDIHYSYDDNGNILNLTDNSSTNLAKTITYDYDDLNRLTSAAVNYVNPSMTDYTRTYQYDSIGNMTSNSALGTMNYANNQPHQLSSYPGKTLSYDLAGNVLNNSVNEMTYDWRSRMDYSRVLLQPGKTYYEYDHNNQRYLKYTTLKVYHPYPCEEDPPEGLGAPIAEGLQTEGETMLLDCGGYYTTDTIEEDKYIDKYFEKDISNNIKSHVYLGDIKLATVNNASNPYYIVSDHLSSNNLVTDNTGNVIETSDYEPFGNVNYSNVVQGTDNQYRYTGQEYDDENALQYFGARYMDNNTARFYSVDSATLHDFYKFLEDPQQFNSYSYVRNNPVAFIDPDGKRLVISNGGGENFTNQTFTTLQRIYPDIQMKQTEAGSEITLQPKSFWSKVADFFSPDLGNEKLMERIIGDKKTVTIEPGTSGQYEAAPTDGTWDNATNGRGEDASVFIDSTFGSIPALNEYNQSTGQVSGEVPPMYVVLSHELIHANRINSGKVNFSAGVNKGLNGETYRYYRNGVEIPIAREEIRTVGTGYNGWWDVTENNIRSLNGLNPRNNY